MRYLILFLAILSLPSCFLKHNLTKESYSVDSSRYSLVTKDTSAKIDSSSFAKYTVNFVTRDTSTVTDDYDQTTVKYYNPAGMIDSSVTTKKGKKTTKKDLSASQQKTDTIAQNHKYEVSKKESDSTTQKNIKTSSKKNSGTNIGTPLSTYIIAAIVLIVLITGVYIAYKLKRKIPV